MSVISIAISTCNSAAYLRQCLTQLLSQSMIADCEVIVIDSGSDQNEAEVCREFAPKFRSLIYERTPRETLYSAWNRALKIATGEFFVNANTDDSLHPDALRVLSSALIQNPDAALAYGDWMWASVPNAPFPWDSSFRLIQHEPYHPSLALFYAYAGCHQFWRKSKLQSIGGFNASRIAAGDYEALCRLIPQRTSAVYVPMAISAFYQNPHGLSRSSAISVSEFYEIRNEFRTSLKISDLFKVSDQDTRGVSDAWASLAQRALDLTVPWADGPTADPQYAEECAHKSLSIEPRNRFARDILNSIQRNKKPATFATRLFGKLLKKRPRHMPIPMTLSRTSSTVFHP